MSRLRNQEGCELNMTPMIDVVFQLIIFFIVMITLSEKRNESIELAKAANSPIVTNTDPVTGERMLPLIIEVDRKGRVSVGSAPLSYADLQNVLKRRHNKFNQFPVMIRADYRTPHYLIRPVLDICAQVGVGRVSFVGIQDPRTAESKERFSGQKR